MTSGYDSLTPMEVEVLDQVAAKVNVGGYVTRLHDGGYLGDVVAGASTVEEVAAAVRAWRASRAVGRSDQRAVPGEHFWAASMVAARHARDRADVREFRSVVLGDDLCDDIAAAAGWIRATAAHEGPGELWRASHPEGGERQWRDVLSFADEGDQASSVPVRPGGVLDELRELSERLADVYPWQAAQAATFVLCDAVPYVIVCRHSSASRPGLVSIVANVECDPATVARVFAARRAEVLGPKPRPLFGKGARIAAFVAARPAWGWGDLWRAWNKEQPDDAVADRRTFRHAALGAEDRLHRGLGLGRHRAGALRRAFGG